MRVVLQRVSQANVEIDGSQKAAIEKGFLILIGIEEKDNKEDIDWLCRKISSLRVFSDEAEKMNLSITDIEGAFLVISQFTLHASTIKGNRPSFLKAAKPAIAIPLYKAFIHQLEKVSQRPVKEGQFGANMKVSLINDGPVTIILDSKNRT